MTLQSLIVSGLVGCCFVYAAWNLMPQVLRRLLAGALLRGCPLPRPVAAYLQKTAQASAGCGCSGCDHAPVKQASPLPAPESSEHVLQFHPRQRR